MKYSGETLGYGQSSKEERMYIYSVVVDSEPELVLELGTMEGGGTTYAIAQGLTHNNHGKLHTFEIDDNYYSKAEPKFRNNEFVECYKKDFLDDISTREDNSVDMIMFDGVSMPEWSEELNRKVLLGCYRLLKNGGDLIIHDFGDVSEIRIDTSNSKVNTIQDYLEENYEFINRIMTTTGLYHFRKVGT